MPSNDFPGRISSTPARIEIEESLTPWSEVLLADLITPNRLKTPLILPGGYTYGLKLVSKRRRRLWSRMVWLSIVVLVALWCLLAQRRETTVLEVNQSSVLPDFDTLRFIDAAHPHIRVSTLNSSPSTSNTLSMLGVGQRVLMGPIRMGRLRV